MSTIHILTLEVGHFVAQTETLQSKTDL